MTGDDLKYLTYEQALEDFVQFENYSIQQFGLPANGFLRAALIRALSPLTIV